MSCDAYQEMVSVYIDYELDDESARTLFGHLSACAGCRQFLQKSLHFRTVASLLPDPGVPPSLDRRALAIPHATPKKGRSFIAAFWRRWRERIAVPLPAAALAITLLLLSTAVAILRTAGPGQAATPEPRVVYVMQLSPIEVHPNPSQ